MSTFVYLNCCRVYIRTIISYTIVNCHYFRRIQWIIQSMTAVLWTGKCRILVFLGQYTVYYILLNTVIFSNQIDELEYQCAPRDILLRNNVSDSAFQNSASHIYAQKVNSHKLWPLTIYEDLGKKKWFTFQKQLEIIMSWIKCGQRYIIFPESLQSKAYINT